MARRASIYLNDELDAAVSASGVAIAELVRRGLGADGKPPVHGIRITADDRVPPGAALLVSGDSVQPLCIAPAACPHRGLSPGAWCKSCQSAVPERRK
jgi:hypothetical protein